MTYDEMIALSRRLATEGRLDDARRVAETALATRRAAPVAVPDPRIAGAFARFGGTGAPPPQGQPSGLPQPGATAAPLPAPQAAAGGATAAPGASPPAADLPRVLRALRAAHETGDTEAATRLAQMARTLQEAGAASGAAGAPQASPAAPAGAAGAPIEVRLPGGEVARFPAGTADAVITRTIDRRFLEMEAEQPGSSGLTPQQLEVTRRRLGAPPSPGLDVPPGGASSWLLDQVAAREAGALLRENLWLGGVLPSPAQAVRNMGENLDGFLWDGDGDPSTLANRGEALAAALNNAGEAMTFGLIGDEADAALRGAGAALVPGGQGHAEAYAERVANNRAQEAALWDQRPGLALTSELGGALMGPGAPARFIGRGVGLLSRLGRGAAVGAGSGAVYGAMEAEGDAVRMEDGDFGGQSHVGGVMDRAVGGLLGTAVGGAGGAALTGIGQGFIRLAQTLKGQPGGQQAVSTVEGLQSAAQRLYSEAEASGVVVPQDALSRLATAATGVVRSGGYHPRIHTRIAGVLEELQDLAGSPAGLGRLELARRVAGSAARSPEPDERRLASLVIDKIDDLVEGLGEGSAPLRQAREIWARMSRLGRVEGIMEDAANAKGSTEAALANGFRSFLRNPRNLRGFSEAERHLMQQIARGSAGVRALRGLAHTLSLNSGQGLALTAAAAYQAGPIAGALPVAGYGARAIADALVRGQGNALARMTGQSDQQRAIASALLSQPNALAGFTTAPTSMGLLDHLTGR